MQGIIRLGDKTTHGGAVLFCSTTMFFGDIGVARKGDRVSCPEHGDTTIVEGNPNYRDCGVPVAFHGHKCGYELTPQCSGGVNVPVEPERIPAR